MFSEIEIRKLTSEQVEEMEKKLRVLLKGVPGGTYAEMFSTVYIERDGEVLKNSQGERFIGLEENIRVIFPPVKALAENKEHDLKVVFFDQSNALEWAIRILDLCEKIQTRRFWAKGYGESDLGREISNLYGRYQGGQNEDEIDPSWLKSTLITIKLETEKELLAIRSGLAGLEASLSMALCTKVPTLNNEKRKDIVRPYVAKAIARSIYRGLLQEKR